MTFDQIKQQLLEAGSSTPDLDSRLLLSMVSGLDPARIMAGDWSLDSAQTRRLGLLIKERAQTPMAYLLGSTEFFGLEFVVDRRVLVPRPESEDLVELALGLGPYRAVYDIGCGSGCLGLAYLANQNPKPDLYLVDPSIEALEVAKENARRLNLIADFWPLGIGDLKPDGWQKDSLILANLPYLDQNQTEAVYRRCPQLVAEPPQALFSGQKGLAIYRQLWPRLGLKPKHLIIEADWSQRAALIAQARRWGWSLLTHRGLALVFEKLNDPALPVAQK